MTARDQLIFDLFTTAIEGGINYWATVESYHWQNEDVEDHIGFYADIHETEAEHPSQRNWRIDRHRMVRGYVLAAGLWRNKISWSSGEKPPRVVTDDTDWDFDAGDADVIVQLGLFEEVIYG